MMMSKDCFLSTAIFVRGEIDDGSVCAIGFGVDETCREGISFVDKLVSKREDGLIALSPNKNSAFPELHRHAFLVLRLTTLFDVE